MKERHWNSLIGTLRRGQCVLVLGPELPLDAPAPAEGPRASLSDALARALADELEADNRRAASASLAAVAQQYEDSEGFGPTALRAEAEHFYLGRSAASSPALSLLAELPFPLILTTCQDRQLPEALKRAGKQPLVQRYMMRGDRLDNPEFVLPLAAQTPLVYHLFGEAGEPASLVLSENDILDFLIAIVSEDPPLPNVLLRALKRPGQSFLFVGFGIRHWHLRVLLKAMLRALDLGRAGSTFAAEPLGRLPASDRDETILFYQRGTRVEVEDTDVEQFLQAVLQRYRAEGGLLAQPALLGQAPRVFISYAREDQDLAARLEAALRQSGFDPWLDRAALQGGEDWALHIETELQTTDFTLVLYTPAFCRKVDSWVNREVNLARKRAASVRGSFLIPLRSTDIAAEDRVRELAEYNEMDLRPGSFDDDLAKLVSLMRREYQRRNR